jgi:RNA polymerase sigma-70 factor (ECF subfamily)
MPDEENRFDLSMAAEASRHAPSRVWSILKAVGVTVGARDLSLDVAAVHAAHADYVWSTLSRLGVRTADLPDMLQEVFVVVLRRAGTYDGACKIRTWLYGICLRVARNYRRKAHRRREVPDEGRGGFEQCSRELGPEEQVVRAQARARLDAILDHLDPEKRAVFVMFEVEGLSCDQIADALSIPVGTVYSRLHAARRGFERSLERWRARERRT